jgi:nucleoside-diphosphate-sugar epimerase
VKLLVTGHHGYIGSVVAPLLAAAGHDVVGLDTYFCRVGDVRDVDASALAGYDAVVHLAALSNDPLGDLNADWTFDVNLDGTIRLARAAREAGVRRFVFASSCSIYGAVAADEWVDEDAPVRPLTPYAESKVRAELALSSLADGQFSPIYLRNATAYGVSPRLRLDVVLNNLVAWGFTTGRVRLLSDGSSWRPLVHVSDIGRAILGVLEADRPLVHDRAFNIGATDENYRVVDLGRIVHEELDGCELEVADHAVFDPRSYRVSFARFESALPNFRPGWTARRGVGELAVAYAEQRLTKDDFDGPRYTRLRQLRRLLDEGLLDTELRWRTAA